MVVLSSKKVLQEKNTTDPNSITSLTLTHKALSDVSCLGEFKNLERLDLGFNNLTSLEGLKSCVNLKWLSVVQNKLHDLKGIEGLTKLTVLNAGKNKLKSIDEVKSLVSLRALILNDNEIRSICKLDGMKELNTLVLSRNPISSLGESLAKLKSITKLSLSNCELQTLGSSLKSCVALKELRLAHNEIIIVPTEFSQLVKLQNLDMGNNLISNWSSLKVLSSLVNLKNLNLQGNPVTEKENLVKKVKKLLPNLQIFNAKPIEKLAGKDVRGKDEILSSKANNKLKFGDDPEIDHSTINETSKKAHDRVKGAQDQGSRKKRKELDETATNSKESIDKSEKKMKKKVKLQDNEKGATSNAEAHNENPEEAKKSKRKKDRKDSLAKERQLDKASIAEETEVKLGKTNKTDNLIVIDSAEAPFTDLFANSADEIPHDKQSDPRVDNINSGLVTVKSKKKKRSRFVDPSTLGLSQVDEIGLGGDSAWA